MKKWKRVIRQGLVVAGFYAAFPVTCHSIFAKSKAAPDDGYEYVTATGSMVPQRVKKGQTAATAGPTGAMSGEEFDKLRQRLNSPGKLPGGG